MYYMYTYYSFTRCTVQGCVLCITCIPITALQVKSYSVLFNALYMKFPVHLFYMYAASFMLFDLLSFGMISHL